jgi:PPOX class probable F420-dependent enzyme
VNADEVREFLKTNHHAVLATRRRDGGVQMSPVAAVVNEHGQVVISSRETAMKVKNLRRDPYAYLCIINDGFWPQQGWAQAEGPVTIVSLPDAMDALVDYYRRASGEHPDWEDYRAAMVRDKRCLIVFPIERAGPTIAG